MSAIAATVLKATLADKVYPVNSQYRSTFWTPQRDAELLALAGEMHQGALARHFGKTTGKIRYRLDLLGADSISLKEASTPTYGEWVGMVNRMAAEQHLTPQAIVPILAGGSYQRACSVRWRAWAAILDENPQYSIAGVARASGHHWTAVIHGLQRIGWTRKLSTAPTS